MRESVPVYQTMLHSEDASEGPNAFAEKRAASLARPIKAPSLGTTQLLLPILAWGYIKKLPVGT